MNIGSSEPEVMRARCAEDGFFEGCVAQRGMRSSFEGRDDESGPGRNEEELGPVGDDGNASEARRKRCEPCPAELQHARAERESSRRGGEKPRGRWLKSSAWRRLFLAESTSCCRGLARPVKSEERHIHANESSREARRRHVKETFIVCPARLDPEEGGERHRSGDQERFESVESDAKFMEAKLQGRLSKVDVKRRQFGTHLEGHPAMGKGRGGGWESKTSDQLSEMEAVW